MSDAAPPPWVKRAPGLSATHKFMLITLWGWGPYKRTGPDDPDGERQPAQPVRPFPSRETLGEITGQALGTVKSQLRALVKAGWVRRDSGSCLTLAWREPGCFEYGEGLDSRPPRLNPRPVESSTPAAEISTPAAESSTPDRLNPRPLSFQGTSNSTSTHLDNSGKPAHITKAVNRAARTSAPVRETDPFEAKLREVSPAAHMQWEPDNQHRASFSWGLRQFIAENSETDAFKVLAAWEAARSTGERRPQLGVLWYTGGKRGRGPTAFRDKVLEREEPAPSEGALSDKGVDKMGELEAMWARRAAKAANS